MQVYQRCGKAVVRQNLLKLTIVILFALACVQALTPSGAAALEPVRFGRDVLPILAANCFSCHGPDEKNRKAGLRLDVETDAKAKRRSGFAVAPNQPEKSLILTRLTSTDPDVVMPPPSSHKQVTPAQVERDSPLDCRRRAVGIALVV